MRHNELIAYGLLVFSRILYQPPNLQCQVWARVTKERYEFQNVIRKRKNNSQKKLQILGIFHLPVYIFFKRDVFSA